MSKTATTKKSIYLFHGEDTYSSHQKALFWKKQFIKKYDDTNIDTHDAKSIDLKNFTSDIEAVPFLADKRLIILKNILTNLKTDAQKSLAESIEKAADTTILIFQEDGPADKRLSLFKKIKKIGHEEEFKAPTPQMINKFILDRAKKDNINIKFTGANHLAQHVKPNLWHIASELEKLRLYANGREITPALISEIVPESITSTIFKLTDALSARNARQAVQTLEVLKDSGEELSRIFHMIVRHFRVLIQVKDLADQGMPAPAIAKQIKQHPFTVKKAYQQTRNFSNTKLAQSYQKLLEIETGTKTGRIRTYQKDDRQFKLALEQFILSSCA